MIEYLLLGSLIAVVCSITIGSIGANANEVFGTINNTIGSKPDLNPPIPPEPDPSLPAYAMLYDDGSLIFQRGNIPDSGKTLIKSYTDFENKKINYSKDVPWYQESYDVLTVTFKNEISPISTYAWFYAMRNCININLEKLNTTNVTNMSNMFNACSKLTSLDITNFNTTNVTTMGNMFSYCSSLTTLNVTSFNTSNVTYMGGMFLSCFSLVSLDVSNFDTTNVTYMGGGMFSGCYKLTSLDITNFNTTNVLNMSSMFSGCSKLTSLDVTNFDTTKVTDMGNMFSGCSSLVSVSLPVNIASSPAVLAGANESYIGIYHMFKGDQKLKDAGQIPVWYVGEYATI